MKKFIRLILIIALGVAVYYYRSEIKDFYNLVMGQYPQVREVTANVSKEFASELESLKREVITPEPLRLPAINQRAFLTVSGTIVETNRHRATAGLPALKGNAKLAAAAQKKAEDMFRQQYFAHDSPQGIGAGDLVSVVGYEFVVVGENLALGNYKDDNELVQAWMDSPGHRANILNSRYTEIGVAVIQGTYEGDKTWMAVQEFGRPLATCPKVDTQIKAQITAKEKVVASLELELDRRREELDRTRSQGRMGQAEVDAYNKKVEEYNAIIAEYKAAAAELKKLVDAYNAQVRAFNICIAQ